ncbi:MAG: hypothetical protein H6702_12675 [Myxococcales bacterium]|nr:hypothetical protein [Myxococcales bacterium]
MRRPHGHTQRLIRKVLGPDDMLDLTVVRTRVEETLVDDEAGTHCTVHLAVVANDGDAFEVRGEGVGLVDAVYEALMLRYAAEHPSLRTLSFDAFDVRAACQEHGCGGSVEVTLSVRNETGRLFDFEAVGLSTLGAAVMAMTGLVVYFVNAERAFLRLHDALSDAQQRHRPDLVEQFRNQLVDLVFDGAEYSGVLRPSDPGDRSGDASWV